MPRRLFLMLAQCIKKIYCLGQLCFSFATAAKPEVTTPAPVQMKTSISMNSNATPEARDVVAGLSASGKLSIVAMPQRADTVERAGQAVMALTMCGRPTAGDLIFTRGQFIGRLAMEGRPWPANTLERSAVMAAGLKMFASTQAQGMSNILAAAKGEQSGYLLPNTQEIAKIVAGTSGKLNMAALAIVKTLWDVSFSVNGVTEHETQVLDGETAEDPVTAGIIEEPTRETTPQYTYDYAGWALSEDGEVVNGGGGGSKVIIDSATFTSTLDAEFGYGYFAAAEAGLFEVGKQYTIVWDGVTYLCTAQDASAVMDGADCLMGNGTAFGLDGNGEPFIIGLTTEGAILFLCLTDTAETEHTVSLYRVDDSADSGGGNTDGLPAITADTVFYAVFKATLRTYAANFYVDGVLESTQQVPYGETAVPPELTGEAGMILEWAPSDFTITGDTDFYGTWVRDYTVAEQEYAFTDETSQYGAYRVAIKALKPLVSGTTYIVDWDGVLYTCTARNVSYKTAYFTASANNAIGNAKILSKFWGYATTITSTEADTSEPFFMFGDNTTVAILTKSTATTHKVCVYAV